MFTLYMFWRSIQDRREHRRTQLDLRLARELCEDAYDENIELRRTIIEHQSRIAALEQKQAPAQLSTGTEVM